MHLGRNVVTPLFLLALLAWNCSKPVKNSAYCNLDIKEGWQEAVSLTIEMQDTLNASQIDICMQIARNTLYGFTHIPVVLEIESPHGTRYTDTLALPLQIVADKENYNRQNGYITINWPYRKNVTTKLCGNWKFTFNPLLGNRDIYRTIKGIGISCRANSK